jgi:hypothetical protein
MSTVVVKQGNPSKSGEKVDTDAAPVVDRVAAAMAADEGKSVEKKQDIAAKATAMTGTTTVTDRLKEQSRQRSRKTPERAAKDAARRGTKAKAKPAAKKPASTGGPVARLTDEWLSAKGKDVKVGDRVKLPDGIVIDVIGRWTRKSAKGNVPMVTGHIVSIPVGAALASVPATGNRSGKKVGDRHNAVAAEATHVKK